MSVRGFLMNSIISRVRAAALGQVGGGPKHDHYSDFGWPETIEFADLQTMFMRNGLAAAAIESYVGKIWESDPELFEREDAHNATEIEKAFKEWAEDRRLWQKLAEADRRGMVGDYAGVILQVADNLDWNRPLGRVKSLDQVWDLIPAWESELRPATWDEDVKSRRYGMPLTYQYNEQPPPGHSTKGGPAPRTLTIHYTRVLLWSSTGDLLGRSILRAGYNALLDTEKVIGGGAEGFWKNARQSLSLGVDSTADLSKLAQSMGTTIGDLGDKLNEVVDDWTKGFDKAFITQGIKPEALNITMPQPGEFQEGTMQMFAAAVRIPVRVLIGNVTGERATVEDEVAWAKRCNGLRAKEKRPLIKQLLNRLELCGALPEKEWYLEWSDLTEGTAAQKLDAAFKLAEINSKTMGGGDYAPFSSDEIREAAGYDVLTEEEIDEREDDEESVEPPPVIDPNQPPAADDPKGEGNPTPPAE